MTNEYHLSFSPKAHLIHVKLVLKDARPNQQISMAAWVPGSYLIRDFSKHIVRLQAFEKGKATTVEQIDKQTWRAGNRSGNLEIEYDLFTFDNAPRGAYLDDSYCFFDGARVFMQVEGKLDAPCKVHLSSPKDWLLATSMQAKVESTLDVGEYLANDYFDLIDHPFVMGDIELHHFEVNNTPHQLAIVGKHYGDIPTLIAATQKICQKQIEFFGDFPEMSHYLFILRVSKDGYGGIEHRNACSLVTSRESLPDGPYCESEAYLSLLGLISHEYFHLWNVKRLRPKVFVKPDLSKPQYTEQMWIFEGITSYYDDLMLVRSGVITKEQYFVLLAKNLTRYFQNPGRNKQSLVESSLTAWNKFYQPDVNSVNANVSYYLKGALVALALDVEIMQRTQGEKSLQNVMQKLWQDLGKNDAGLEECDFEQYATKVTGLSLNDFFDKHIRQTVDMNFEKILDSVGLMLNLKEVDILLSFGLRCDENNLKVLSVLNQSLAEKTGLAPGDELVAVDNLKAELAQLKKTLSVAQGNIDVHVFRDDRLKTLQANVSDFQKDTGVYEVLAQKDITTEKQRLQDIWLQS